MYVCMFVCLVEAVAHNDFLISSCRSSLTDLFTVVCGQVMTVNWLLMLMWGW